MSLDEFAKQWSGNLLLAVPTVRLDPRRIGNSASPWQRLELLRSQQSIMLEAMVCALCLTLLAVVMLFEQHHYRSLPPMADFVSSRPVEPVAENGPWGGTL